MTSPATLQFNKAVSDVTAALAAYLPNAGAPPIPAPSLSVVNVVERSIGIGRLRGVETRGGLAAADVFGGRVEALVRFELWAIELSDLYMATLQLQQRIRDDADALRAVGFLRLGPTHSTSPELIESAGGWRQSVEYSALYEYEYRDTDGAESLIARIPVLIDSEYDERTVVTGGMTRWDDTGAPPLVVRGAGRVALVRALDFVPGVAPSGTVTLTRTFDAVSGAPTAFPTLAAFLASVTDPTTPERHAEVVFPSLAVFLAEFALSGAPLTLGDWNLDAAPDSYVSRALVLDPPIQLPQPVDRLELTFEHPAFDQSAVVYLRATGGTTT